MHGVDALEQQRQAAAVPDGGNHHRCGRMPRWACVLTQPQAERWAHSNLTRIGYTVYLPIVAVQRRDRTIPTMHHTVLVPLFSRYLFVVHHPQDPWAPIRYAPGVSSLVTAHGVVAYARAGAVEALQAGEELRRTHPSGAGAGRRVGRSWGCGEACQLVGGPFDGHAGVVVAAKRSSVQVALLVFGELRSVMVPAHQLTSRVA